MFNWHVSCQYISYRIGFYCVDMFWCVLYSIGLLYIILFLFFITHYINNSHILCCINLYCIDMN